MRSSLFLTISLILCVFFTITADAAVEIKLPDGVTSPPPKIAASPSKITLKIGARPTNGAIKLFNLGDQPVTINTSVNNWILNENNELIIAPPTPQSLDQWIIINPVKFSIPANNSQTVRFSVRPRAKPENGEHRAIVFFDQQLSDTLAANSVRVKFRLGIIIYGLAGDVVRKGILHSINFEQEPGKGNIRFDIESIGNANIRMSGQYSLWPKADFPGIDNVPEYNMDAKQQTISKKILQLGKINITAVLAGTRRIIQTHLQLPEKPGDYVLWVKGKLGDAKPFSKMIALTVTKEGVTK